MRDALTKARLARVAMLGLLVGASMGCAILDPWRPQEPSLDGWPLGAELDCDELEDEAGLVTLARDQLSAADRPSVIDVSCYQEGWYLEHGVQVAMSGNGRGIGMAAPIVFTFADGSRRAVGVGCGWWATVNGTGRRVHDTCGLRDPISPDR